MNINNGYDSIILYSYVHLASNPEIHGECSNVEGDLANDHTLPFRLDSLVRVENPNDRWCLARAIIIGLRYRECGENRMEPNFLSYIGNQRYHVIVARRLLSDAGIPTTKDFFTLEDASKIQTLLNARFGSQEVRIVIFSSAKNNGIIWKGWNGRPAKFNLWLYHRQDHFSFLSSPKALLKVFFKLGSFKSICCS